MPPLPPSSASSDFCLSDVDMTPHVPTPSLGLPSTLLITMYVPCSHLLCSARRAYAIRL